VHCSCWRITDTARPMRQTATIAGVANAPASLLEEQEQQSVALQTEPAAPRGVGGRNTVLMSAQLSLTMESLQSQAKQICEQVLSDKHRIEQITAQLEEDDKMQKALAEQVKELKAGKTEAVEKMQRSLSEATKDGHDTLETESFIELQATELGGLEKLSEDGDNDFWDPVSEKSIQAEDLLNLLTLQEAKVSIQIEQGKLDKEELTSNIEMLKATLQQLRTLQAGRTDGLLAISNAFAQSYRALMQDDSGKTSKPVSDTESSSTSPTKSNIAFVTEVCEAQTSGGKETPVEKSSPSKEPSSKEIVIKTEDVTTTKMATRLVGERADDSEDIEIKKTVLLKKKSAGVDAHTLKEGSHKEHPQLLSEGPRQSHQSFSLTFPPTKALFSGLPEKETLDLETLTEGAREAARVSDKIVQEVNRALEAEKERSTEGRHVEHSKHGVGGVHPTATESLKGTSSQRQVKDESQDAGRQVSVAHDIEGDRADDVDFLQVRNAERQA